MNVVTSTVAFDQMHPDTAGQSHDMGDISLPGRALPGVDADAPAPASAARLAAIAALSGALSAAIVAIALFVLLPPRTISDPRLFALGRDLDDMKAQLAGAPDKLRELEVSAVAAGETPDGLRAGLPGNAASLAALRADLAALTETSRKAVEAQAGIALPALLGIAVVQLRVAIDQGQAFDWELVNLQGIAGRRPEAAVELARLAPIAETGVPTAEQINAGLRALIAMDERGPSLIVTGLNALGRALGTPLSVQAPGLNAAPLLRAASRASAGDYAQGARELRAISPDLATAARPVLLAMENRAIAQSASTRLMVMARDGLATQLRASQ